MGGVSVRVLQYWNLYEVGIGGADAGATIPKPLRGRYGRGADACATKLKPLRGSYWGCQYEVDLGLAPLNKYHNPDDALA